MEYMDLWIHRLAKLSLGILSQSIDRWPIDGSIKCPAQSIKRADPSIARDINIYIYIYSKKLRIDNECLCHAQLMGQRVLSIVQGI